MDDSYAVNSPGFDSWVLKLSEIWEAADELKHRKIMESFDPVAETSIVCIFRRRINNK